MGDISEAYVIVTTENPDLLIMPILCKYKQTVTMTNALLGTNGQMKSKSADAFHVGGKKWTGDFQNV